jgi:DNA-directed RNA polymerase specialized sigma24 family protein
LPLPPRRCGASSSTAPAARRRSRPAGPCGGATSTTSRPTLEGRPDLSLALDEALTELERHDEAAAQLVKLRYFAGMSHQQAADSLGISRRAADRLWALARAWLFQRIGEP